MGDTLVSFADAALHCGAMEFNNIQIHAGAGHLLTILPDGTIERGPAFTTTNQASLEFWEILSKTFPMKGAA
jgi:hypothetical protein